MTDSSEKPNVLTQLLDPNNSLIQGLLGMQRSGIRPNSTDEFLVDGKWECNKCGACCKDVSWCLPDWTVEDGVLVGRNGRNWSEDPETTGSWLRTAKQYADFRLELQYAISKNGNSGVFFRSAAEKNPAFTGYEMQITDSGGQEPSKHAAGSIYDVVAPSKNLVRPAGRWNTVTIVARGSRIVLEMNGEKVIETELNRSMLGYIGLQNHDERAVVKYRNIRVEEM